MKKVTELTGSYARLDPAHRTERGLLLESLGLRPRSMEALYMAARVLIAATADNDQESIGAALEIARASTGVQAKERHKALTQPAEGVPTTMDLRTRVAIHIAANLAKFTLNPKDEAVLKGVVEAGLEIEEGNYLGDVLWGVSPPSDPESGLQGKGYNLTGRVLGLVGGWIADPKFVRPDEDVLAANIFELRFLNEADQIIEQAGVAA